MVDEKRCYTSPGEDYFEAFCKIKKGAREYLTLQPTNAARRFKRSIIRQREKARRDKLKYGEE